MNNSPSDEDLLNAWFAGDAGACEIFFRRHVGRIVGYCLKKGLSKEEAEDVAQGAFIRLSRSINRYECGRPALPWFFTMVTNELNDFWRLKCRYQKRIAALAALDTSVHAQSSELDDIHVSIDTSLSLTDAKVIRGRLLEEKSYKDMADGLNSSEANVRKIFSRAIQKLRKHLSAKGRNDD